MTWDPPKIGVLFVDPDLSRTLPSRRHRRGLVFGCLLVASFGLPLGDTNSSTVCPLDKHELN